MIYQSNSYIEKRNQRKRGRLSEEKCPIARLTLAGEVENISKSEYSNWK